jgi:histidyl-tRNA synthetase
MTIYNSVRGMRDWWGEDVAHRRRIEQRSAEIAACYGVTWVETPILEHQGVFVKTLGESSDVVGKEMYSLQDKGEDTLVLRPEGTAPVVRAFIQAGGQLPQKYIYTGPMFRYERPQKGRYRQFYQLGVEYFLRTPSIAMDVECLSLAHHIISAVGIRSYALHLGTLGSREEREAYRSLLVSYFEPYKNDLSQDSQRRLVTNPLRILDSKSPEDQALVKNAPRLMDHLQTESRQFFNDVCQGLTDLDIPFVVDDRMVRGLDYYGHTTFEFKSAEHLGSQDAFGGGGRYDGLISQMGSKQDGYGIGWALGLDRLMLMMSHQTQGLPVVFILSLGEDALCQRMAYQLRQAGIACEVLLGDGQVGKKMQQAHKRGAAYTLVIGESERVQQSVQVKDMNTAKTQQVLFENLSDFLSHPLFA